MAVLPQPFEIPMIKAMCQHRSSSCCTSSNPATCQHRSPSCCTCSIPATCQHTSPSCCTCSIPATCQHRSPSCCTCSIPATLQHKSPSCCTCSIPATCQHRPPSCCTCSIPATCQHRSPSCCICSIRQSHKSSSLWPTTQLTFQCLRRTSEKRVVTITLPSHTSHRFQRLSCQPSGRLKALQWGSCNILYAVNSENGHSTTNRST